MVVGLEQMEAHRLCSFVTLQTSQSIESFDGRSWDLLMHFEPLGLELKLESLYYSHLSQDLMG